MSRPVTRERTPTPLLALFWGLLFLAAQAVSVAHLHADEGADVSCGVCTLVKSHTAAADCHPAPAAVVVQHADQPSADPLVRIDATHSPFEARAPPRV
jgi:hypothetical protein